MSFKEFDRSNIEKIHKQYENEVKERWGNTDAYMESKHKTASYGAQDWEKIRQDSEVIYQSFAANMQRSPDDPDVQKLVKNWQDFISKYFYKCTNEILSGLGKMYSNDPRFTENIDQYGKGLADFMSKAIEAYCN